MLEGRRANLIDSSTGTAFPLLVYTDYASCKKIISWSRTFVDVDSNRALPAMSQICNNNNNKKAECSEGSNIPWAENEFLSEKKKKMEHKTKKKMLKI